MTSTTTATEFTTSAFVRSHGRQPRGTGTWAFQRATRHTAFSSELVGEVEFFHGTLTEAKAKAKAAGMAGLVAVLP
jgi:hypothetical protein